MLKVLIADDEVLERVALSKIISAHMEYVKVIGEASNGRVAIEMAKQHSPDIIFMDIKMPGINGLEAVRAIKQYNPHTRFIMVSAFNTFDYAKEAMNQGVKEFILKPSRKDDILESLSRVCKEIMAEKEQDLEKNKLLTNYEQALTFAQKEWLSSLLVNPVHDTSFEEMSRLLGFEIKAGYSIVFSFYSSASAQIDMFMKWLQDTLKRVSNQGTIIGTPMDSKIPVLFLCRDEAEIIKYKSQCQAMMRAFNMLFKEKFADSQLYMGIGEPYRFAKELSHSFIQALFALEQLDRREKRNYSFARKESFSTAEPAHDLEVERSLLESITQGDISLAVTHYQEFVQHALARTEGNISALKKSFQELLVVISRTLHELGLQYKPNFSVDDHNEAYPLIEGGKAFVMAVVQYIQVWRNKETKGLLQKAKEYLEIHYAEPLTLEQVAEHIELSPYYFSKLFKERFGMTFIDYLTDIRIAHAKQEMSDLAKSLKEICYSIGYKDPNYFSRVFKKHTGLSPSEYRKALSDVVYYSRG
ncbi:response regulator [Peribacillus sp. SCS-155]|uniref:response regulator n=1 Tax=Peribacillus sedimenti TaxID=3115297 RepID=UPI0039064175